MVITNSILLQQTTTQSGEIDKYICLPQGQKSEGLNQFGDWGITLSCKSTAAWDIPSL